MEEAEVKVMVADESHIKYIDTILTTIAEAAKSVVLVSPSVHQSMLPPRCAKPRRSSLSRAKSSQVSATSKHGATSTMLPHQV